MCMCRKRLLLNRIGRFCIRGRMHLNVFFLKKVRGAMTGEGRFLRLGEVGRSDCDFVPGKRCFGVFRGVLAGCFITSVGIDLGGTVGRGCGGVSFDCMLAGSDELVLDGPLVRFLESNRTSVLFRSSTDSESRITAVHLGRGVIRGEFVCDHSFFCLHPRVRVSSSSFLVRTIREIMREICFSMFNHQGRIRSGTWGVTASLSVLERRR